MLIVAVVEFSPFDGLFEGAMDQVELWEQNQLIHVYSKFLK